MGSGGERGILSDPVVISTLLLLQFRVRSITYRTGYVSEDSKTMEHYATKRSLLLKKQEQCMKKIRELGSLPSDTFAKYQKTGSRR